MNKNRIYNSCVEAAQDNNLDSSYIAKVSKLKKYAGGFLWERF